MNTTNDKPASPEARPTGSGDTAKLNAPNPADAYPKANAVPLAAAGLPAAPSLLGNEPPYAPHQPRYNDGVSRYDQASYVVTDPAALPPSDGARVKMDLSRRSNDNLIGFVGTHIAMTVDNPTFTEPSPTNAELQAGLTDFQQKNSTAEIAYAQYQDQVAARDQSRASLESMMRRRGAYVQEASNGNRPAILSSGLEVSNPRTPVGPLAPPININTELNGVAGVLKLRWKPVKDARGYLVQCSPDVMPREFTQIKNTSKANLTLENLTLGETLVFRIASQGGSTGQSPWSAEVIRGVA
jgi:hypothetical protein